MSVSIQDTGDYGPKTIAGLESAIQAGNCDVGVLRNYHQQIVESAQIRQGRRFYQKLLKSRPHDNRIRSLYIALCLQEKDYLTAMAAIQTMVATSKPDDGLISAGLDVRAKLNALGNVRPQKAVPSLSLCMIVKNESGRIGPCLNVHNPLVDEIIIVDSGSTDKTMDIASIFGAKTYSLTWGNDFASARNFSLAKASCDWVLILDADEVIAPQDHELLMQLLRKGADQKAAYTLETRNYTYLTNALGWQANKGNYPRFETGLGWYPSHKVRLFPRCDAIRFCYPVHELVEPSIKAIDMPILQCSVPVHHYGNLNESKNKDKARQYFQIGYEKLAHFDQDSSAIRELAVQAGQLEHWNEALELWHKLLDKKPDFTEALVNIASIYWQLGNFKKALNYGCRANRIDPQLKEAKYNIAVSRLLLEQASEAIDILQKLLNEHRDYLQAGFMLAAAYACVGDFKQSELAFRTLSTSLVGNVVPMAVQDLSRKLRTSGLVSYALRLESASAMQDESNPCQE